MFFLSHCGQQLYFAGVRPEPEMILNVLRFDLFILYHKIVKDSNFRRPSGVRNEITLSYFSIGFSVSYESSIMIEYFNIPP